MSNSIDNLFEKTFHKKDKDIQGLTAEEQDSAPEQFTYGLQLMSHHEGTDAEKDVNPIQETSSSVVSKLIKRKEQQTQKTYCSWINEWNDVVENNNKSHMELDIPKHTLCGDIGCHFTEVEKENIETIVYEVYVSYSQKAKKKYYFVEKLEFSTKVKDNKKYKTYYIEDPQKSGNQLVFLHFDKNNNHVLVNMGILLPDAENGHIIKVSKEPMVFQLGNSIMRDFNEKDFSFDNVTEEQKNDFLNGALKDSYCDIDIESTIITIDTETYEPVPKEIIFENGEYKARLKMKVGKHYFSFKIQSKETFDSKLTDFQLAECYYYGRGDFPEDKIKAAELFERIGDGESLRYLAHIWLDESGVTIEDLNEALFFLEEANKLEGQKAGCELIYYIMKYLCLVSVEKKQELIDKMFSLISIMEDKKNASAMFLAGYIYEKGIANDRDMDKAFDYYYQAAYVGEKTAKIRLGIYSREDECDKKTCHIAFQNLQQNSGFSDYCMGRFLYDTEELYVNTSDILHFYEIAAEAGCYYAIKELAEVYTVGNRPSINPDPARAIILYERLTDISDIYIDWGIKLANYYLDGKGCEICEKNDKKAFELLNYLSANYTDDIVANNLGWMYKNGRGCLIDYSKAKALFESSTSKSAYYHLGDMYENGLGVDLDIDKAISLYKTAVEKGHIKAKERLDKLSQSQNGVSLKEIHNELINVRQGISDANDKLEHANSELSMTRTEVQQTREDMKNQTAEIVSQIKMVKSFVERDLLNHMNSMQNTLGNYIKETVEKEFEDLSQYFSEEKKIAKELKSKSDFINCRTENEDVNELVAQEQVHLQTLFGEKWKLLDPTTKSSLCSAGVLWKACADIKDESFDFSGICISATSALELELKRCFYFGFQAFLEQKYGAPSFEVWPEMLLKKDKGELYLEKGNGDDFTIGSLPFLLGKYGLNNIKNELHRTEQENLLKDKIEEYLVEVMIRKNTNGTNRESLIYGKNNLVYKTESVRRDYRNPAAHCNLINKMNAQKCYVSIIGKIESFDFKSDITSLLIQLYELIDINKVSSYLVQYD